MGAKTKTKTKVAKKAASKPAAKSVRNGRGPDKATLVRELAERIALAATGADADATAAGTLKYATDLAVGLHRYDYKAALAALD